MPGLFADAVTLYVLELETRGASLTTQYAYKKELVNLASRYPEKELAELTRDDLSIHERGRDCAAATRRKAHTALNGFFEWCIAGDRIHANPCASIKAPPKRRREPSYWTAAELARVLAASDTPRNRVLLETLARTGQRLDVVRTLTWDRIRCFDEEDRHDPVIRFPRGKNGENHSLPTHAEFGQAVSRAALPRAARADRLRLRQLEASASGRRPRHLVHFLLGFVTYGVWWMVWLGVCVFKGERRESYAVDPAGNVSIQQIERGGFHPQVTMPESFTPSVAVKWVGVAVLALVVLFVGSAMVAGAISAMWFVARRGVRAPNPARLPRWWVARGRVDGLSLSLSLSLSTGIPRRPARQL